MISLAHVSQFTFNQSNEIRTVLINSEVWFVAKDVFETLALTWNGSRTLSIIPDTWRLVVKLTTNQNKGVVKLTTPCEKPENKRGGGVQDTHVINFKAVCKIAFRSNKPEADNFTNWAAEVIEQVLKTGKYEAPKPVEKRDYLTNSDMNNFKRLIWMCTFHLGYKDAWNQGIWHSLRKVTGVPSPAKFEVQHLPVLAQEFQRILNIITVYTDAKHECETTLIKRVIREHGDHMVLQTLLNNMRKSADDSANELNQALQKQLPMTFNQECLNLLNRRPNGYDHSDCNERLI